MATIKKKIWPKFYELVESGKKNFELRVADFKIKESDTLILEEYDPKIKKYTGRKLAKTVKYVLRFRLDDFGQQKEIEENGIYVIQI